MELWRAPLGPAGTPGDVLRVLRGDPRPFLLVGGWAGGGAVAGAAPLAPDDPAAAALGLAAPAPGAVTAAPAAAPAPGSGTWTPVGGAWVGVLAYGLGEAVERLPPRPRRPVPRPAVDGAAYDHVLRMAPGGEWWFEALVTPARRAALRARLAALRERLAAGPPPGRPWRLHGLDPAPPGHDGHRWAVADAVRRIAAGELFQANLCLRLEGELEGDPLEAFAAAAARLRPAMGAFVTLADGGALLSASPELFLRRTGRTASTGPIKGTAPRPEDDPARAAAARAALEASAKDAAEHVMIVDLMRNDLGRVARYGSVRADPSPVVEAHPGLWHLVSTVRAELRDDATDADLVRATFPPGSVTGAPKVQAMRIIPALEGTGREAYTGAIGFAGPVAGLHLNVAIRTLEVAGPPAPVRGGAAPARRRAWLGCGGGIVADSDPEAELREALAKARPLVEALGGRVAEPGPWRRRAVPPPVGAPRPDPALGLLETVRVVDGEAQHLDRHLGRLAASAATLGHAVPDGLAGRARAAAAAAGPGVHRLRLVVRDGLAAVAAGPAPAAAPVADLGRVCVPGGLGPHKWADRHALGATALIVDADGLVLEATWATVWIAEGGRLVTPPADGRLLPGVTRARLLEHRGLDTAEEPVDLARLDAADHVLLSSSLRLVTPVGAAAEPLAAGLRAALSAGCAPSASARPSAGRGSSPARGR